ncbi:MAG TPA: FAD-binding oxidoreductase [Vicinamibacterales bacterium]|nr:FAD-binding oxidoreductase [Vicinamibacterales bacterium]
MPGYGAKYWSERTSRRRTYPKLRGDHTADAVVIGGGLTGSMSAYLLANAGLDVILLESNRLAEGSTAGSLGVIVPEPDAWFRTVESAAGRRPPRVAWKEAHRSASELATTIKKLGIRCDLKSAPYLINAQAPEEALALRKEQFARRDAGVVASWMTPAAVRAETALESTGGLKPGVGYTYDPVRAALGFAAAAEEKGARIFEKSEARKTTFTRKDATVVLMDAKIRTDAVIVATGEPGTVFSQLRRHVRRSSGYVVVTEPMPAAMRRETGKRDSIVTGASAENRHWLRWLPEDRAMFAGAIGPLTPARQKDKALVQRTAQLMYEFSVRYPAISGLPAHWGWETEVVSTVDTLPWIGPHRNYPFHFFALGFGWHGDSLSWLAARLTLRYLTGLKRKDDEALGFARHLG